MMIDRLLSSEWIPSSAIEMLISPLSLGLDLVIWENVQQKALTSHSNEEDQKGNAVLSSRLTNGDLNPKTPFRLSYKLQVTISIINSDPTEQC